MFGYVRYDMPNLYIKDFMLYKALYCGLCKGIGVSCGQAARFGLTYDVAFLSALLHNIAGIDVKVEKSHCVEHCIRKRPIAAVDALTEELGALNTVLCYYKLSDDVADGGRGRGRRLWFRRGFKRAKKKYPELVKIVDGFMKEQAEIEKKRTPSPDMAADATANMMRALSDYFLKDKATVATGGLFYELGKWVYLIDALDDYDKDKKKRRYNPFVLSYGSAGKEELLKTHGKEVRFIFDALFFSLRENLAQIEFAFNRDLTDNIILRGLPAETKRVMCGCKKEKMEKKL